MDSPRSIDNGSPAHGSSRARRTQRPGEAELKRSADTSAKPAWAYDKTKAQGILRGIVHSGIVPAASPTRGTELRSIFQKVSADDYELRDLLKDTTTVLALGKKEAGSHAPLARTASAEIEAIINEAMDGEHFSMAETPIAEAIFEQIALNISKMPSGNKLERDHRIASARQLRHQFHLYLKMNEPDEAYYGKMLILERILGSGPGIPGGPEGESQQERILSAICTLKESRPGAEAALVGTIQDIIRECGGVFPRDLQESLSQYFVQMPVLEGRVQIREGAGARALSRDVSADDLLWEALRPAMMPERRDYRGLNYAPTSADEAQRHKQAIRREMQGAITWAECDVLKILDIQGAQVGKAQARDLLVQVWDMTTPSGADAVPVGLMQGLLGDAVPALNDGAMETFSADQCHGMEVLVDAMHDRGNMEFHGTWLGFEDNFGDPKAPKSVVGAKIMGAVQLANSRVADEAHAQDRGRPAMTSIDLDGSPRGCASSVDDDDSSVDETPRATSHEPRGRADLSQEQRESMRAKKKSFQKMMKKQLSKMKVKGREKSPKQLLRDLQKASKKARQSATVDSDISIRIASPGPATRGRVHTPKELADEVLKKALLVMANDDATMAKNPDEDPSIQVFLELRQELNRISQDREFVQRYQEELKNIYLDFVTTCREEFVAESPDNFTNLASHFQIDSDIQRRDPLDYRSALKTKLTSASRRDAQTSTFERLGMSQAVQRRFRDQAGRGIAAVSGVSRSGGVNGPPLSDFLEPGSRPVTLQDLDGTNDAQRTAIQDLIVLAFGNDRYGELYQVQHEQERSLHGVAYEETQRSGVVDMINAARATREMISALEAKDFKTMNALVMRERKRTTPNLEDRASNRTNIARDVALLKLGLGPDKSEELSGRVITSAISWADPKGKGSLYFQARPGELASELLRFDLEKGSYEIVEVPRPSHDFQLAEAFPSLREGRTKSGKKYRSVLWNTREKIDWMDGSSREHHAQVEQEDGNWQDVMIPLKQMQKESGVNGRPIVDMFGDYTNHQKVLGFARRFEENRESSLSNSDARLPGVLWSADIESAEHNVDPKRVLSEYYWGTDISSAGNPQVTLPTTVMEMAARTRSLIETNDETQLNSFRLFTNALAKKGLLKDVARGIHLELTQWAGEHLPEGWEIDDGYFDPNNPTFFRITDGENTFVMDPIDTFIYPESRIPALSLSEDDNGNPVYREITIQAENTDGGLVFNAQDRRGGDPLLRLNPSDRVRHTLSRVGATTDGIPGTALFYLNEILSHEGSENIPASALASLAHGRLSTQNYFDLRNKCESICLSDTGVPLSKAIPETFDPALQANQTQVLEKLAAFMAGHTLSERALTAHNSSLEVIGKHMEAQALAEGGEVHARSSALDARINAASQAMHNADASKPQFNSLSDLLRSVSPIEAARDLLNSNLDLRRAALDEFAAKLEVIRDSITPSLVQDRSAAVKRQVRYLNRKVRGLLQHLDGLRDRLSGNPPEPTALSALANAMAGSQFMETAPGMQPQHTWLSRYVPLDFTYESSDGPKTVRGPVSRVTRKVFEQVQYYSPDEVLSKEMESLGRHVGDFGDVTGYRSEEDEEDDAPVETPRYDSQAKMRRQRADAEYAERRRKEREALLSARAATQRRAEPTVGLSNSDGEYTEDEDDEWGSSSEDDDDPGSMTARRAPVDAHDDMVRGVRVPEPTTPPPAYDFTKLQTRYGSIQFRDNSYVISCDKKQDEPGVYKLDLYNQDGTMQAFNLAESATNQNNFFANYTADGTVGIAYFSSHDYNGNPMLEGEGKPVFIGFVDRSGPDPVYTGKLYREGMPPVDLMEVTAIKLPDGNAGRTVEAKGDDPMDSEQEATTRAAIDARRQRRNKRPGRRQTPISQRRPQLTRAPLDPNGRRRVAGSDLRHTKDTEVPLQPQRSRRGGQQRLAQTPQHDSRISRMKALNRRRARQRSANAGGQPQDTRSSSTVNPVQGARLRSVARSREQQRTDALDVSASSARAMPSAEYAGITFRGDAVTAKVENGQVKLSMKNNGGRVYNFEPKDLVKIGDSDQNFKADFLPGTGRTCKTDFCVLSSQDLGGNAILDGVDNARFIGFAEHTDQGIRYTGSIQCPGQANQEIAEQAQIQWADIEQID